MESIPIDPYNPEPGAIIRAAEAIRRGFVVIVPTDTVYGLAANALDEKAIARVFVLKKRPRTKPLPLFVKNIAMARKLAYISDDVSEKLKEFWPGPVTVVLYKKDIIPAIATAGGETVGLRMSDHRVVNELVRAVDIPLTATSANISGIAPSHDINVILEQLSHEHITPDLVLNAGVLPGRKPSTIIDLTRGQPYLLRMGPITKRDLQRLLRK